MVLIGFGEVDLCIFLTNGVVKILEGKQFFLKIQTVLIGVLQALRVFSEGIRQLAYTESIFILLVAKMVTYEEIPSIIVEFIKVNVTFWGNWQLVYHFY